MIENNIINYINLIIKKAIKPEFILLIFLYKDKLYIQISRIFIIKKIAT